MKELQFDDLISKIAHYVAQHKITSELAYTTAWHALIDSIGCAALALRYPECAKLLGPWQEGTVVKHGVRVPGTAFANDVVKAAFDIGATIRWLDYNDTWLAAEWGHPSDNLGAILACGDLMAQRGADVNIHTVLTAMIKAYEIQGVLALKNAFNKHGLDHVALVKIASTAVATQLLGGNEHDIKHAVSQAWIDGHSLRTYRHAPNTGSRKSWAAGDATSRAVQLALITLRGENGYASAITAPRWGFQDVIFNGEPIELDRDFDCYVMENILFKIAYPAEFHAQTAVEAAFQLHPQVAGQLDKIASIELETQEAGKRIIDKSGALQNPADRDHCLQYMVACGLLFGKLTADHYQDHCAKDPRIDALRAKMKVSENPRFTEAYFAADKRAIPNSVRVQFTDGTATERVEVEYPVGHRRRREEGIPLLLEKFIHNMGTHFPRRQLDVVLPLMLNQARLEQCSVAEFMGMLRFPG